MTESTQHLPDQVMVMGGVTSRKSNQCLDVLPVKLNANTPIAHVHIDDKMTIKPLAQ